MAFSFMNNDLESFSVVNNAPTFEDLSIDDTIGDYERCIKYSRSKIGLQRLVHIQMIADVAQSVGFEKTLDKLLPILEDCVGDGESPVRQQCAEQLALIAKYFYENPQGYDAIMR